MLKLNTSIQLLSGVGPKIAEKLKRLGIESVRDLLFYYPRTWQDFSKPRKISSLRIGDEAIINAKISQIKQARTRRRWMSIIEAELSDDSGEIKAIWFNQPFLMNILKPGSEFLFAGKVNWDFQKKIKTFSVSQLETEPSIFSVYPETEGLTSKYLRKLLKSLLTFTDTPGVSVGEYLPDKILKTEKILGLADAIQKIHFPKDSKDIDFAKRRLSFDELFLVSLRLQEVRKELSHHNAPALQCENKVLQEFVKNLPYKLTNAQRKTAWEIIQDISKSKPMNRLLEGDVGSGKTVVAAMAVLVCAQSKMQSVWLAPTEILANQHFVNVKKLLPDIKIGLLTSANKKADLEKDDLIIGTHALIQKDIQIPRLGLIIVDEQHRFGVKQRAYLRKGTVPMGTVPIVIPHLLSMTATPIPRTMALTLYGDLDLSVIDEMPKGRQKIVTKVIAPQSRAKAYQFIESQVKEGRQVFVICPLIEEGKTSDKLFDIDRKNAVKEYEKLRKETFPHLKIGLMHGKLKSKEKDETMRNFANGKIDILVSTAVVEVGIDIQNATVMMIESAERFGLAQLHQFRGRVGRGEHQSYCFLFSESWSEATKKRLQAMETHHSGFELAEIDLQLRGPGELSGIRQSGLPDLRMASFSDIILVKKAKQAAEDIIADGIEKYPKLIKKLTEFESSHHLE